MCLYPERDVLVFEEVCSYHYSLFNLFNLFNITSFSIIHFDYVII